MPCKVRLSTARQFHRLRQTPGRARPPASNRASLTDKPVISNECPSSLVGVEATETVLGKRLGLGTPFSVAELPRHRLRIGVARKRIAKAAVPVHLGGASGPRIQFRGD